ncbi:MAG: hypothetical protein KatS3mg105_3302 [Gemmatales bacterium]|nr:MAG: hypothetical protein KatS3mg105_3302 [Gemmatales bacterium]
MAATDFQLGMNAKVYRNTATYASPTWSEITIVRDVTLNLSSGEFDASTRGTGGWRQTARTLKEASVDINILYKQGDAGYNALRDSYLNGTLIDMAIMSDNIATSGSEGLRAEMDVFEFNRGEPLEEGLTIDVTVKPRPSANAPTWMIVP